MNKKYLITFFIAALLLVPVVVFAADIGADLLPTVGDTGGYADADETTFAETLGRVVQIILSFVGVIFLGLTVYAGFLWMTARGESQQIDKAKEMIRASIIGLIITLAAYSVTAFVVPALLGIASGGS